MAKKRLGKQELLVLVALLCVGREANEALIARQLAEVGADCVGSVYAALERLGRKGYVSSSRGLRASRRLSRARKFFHVTSKGKREITDAQRTLTRLWRDVAMPVEGS
ncbi:MAG TPA: helix-turn-helix transcriptional regulator [Vicinamibacterales bacterium]|nr:helix-turn-helix transcriptional regulator [Vicinamibacterales bacterium]